MDHYNISAYFLCSIFFYPNYKQTNGIFKFSVTKQKVFDFGLVFSCALIIALGLNNFSSVPYHDSNTSTLNGPKAHFIVHDNNSKIDKAANRSIIHKFKKSFSTFISTLKNGIKQLKNEF